MSNYAAWGYGRPRRGNVAAYGLGLAQPVEPGTVVTDVIGVTDDTDRTIAYVRIITDDIGIVDVAVVPFDVPDFDLDELVIERADPIRKIYQHDMDRLLDEIDEYRRFMGRGRVDLDRVLTRYDAERTICSVDDGVDPWS